jgi:ribulose-phosphate 3-epimerase
VAPSLLSADVLHLAEELAAVERAGADLLHLDVMDAHFVDNLSYGPHLAKAVCAASSLPVDCHLMVEDPADYAMRFVEAGAACVSFHLELDIDHAQILRRIREAGAKAGIVVNPSTPLDEARHRPLLAHCDLFLVMSVHPGFAGQSFDPSVLGKLGTLADWRGADGLDFVLEIDGGIDERTAPAAREAGAQVLVSGSAFFGSSDYAAYCAELRGRGA